MLRLYETEISQVSRRRYERGSRVLRLRKLRRGAGRADDGGGDERPEDEPIHAEYEPEQPVAGETSQAASQGEHDGCREHVRRGEHREIMSSSSPGMTRQRATSFLLFAVGVAVVFVTAAWAVFTLGVRRYTSGAT